MPITAVYDRDADALYVRLRDGERRRAVEIDDSTYVDVDADEGAIGIEFLYPSLGLNVQAAARAFGLEPQLAAIITAISGTDAPISPPTMTGGQRLASTSTIMINIEGTVPAARGIVSAGVGHADRFIQVVEPV